MKQASLQAVLSILVVSIFLLVSALIALAPIIGGYPPEPYTEHLKSFASLYSGVIGVIIGYFFGRRESPKDA